MTVGDVVMKFALRVRDASTRRAYHRFALGGAALPRSRRENVRFATSQPARDSAAGTDRSAHHPSLSGNQTYRMPYAIDVAFLDRRGTVLHVENVPPNCVRVCAGARVALAMALGMAAKISLARGHVLSPSSGS